MDHSANRIFISYRRDDAAGYAGRLEQALESRLGRGSTFRDVLDVAPGEDFVAAIRARLAGAQAVLVLIGPRWAGDGEPEPGRRRIDDEADFVRLEVAVALASSARVIPVLLPGAGMPAEAQLPLPLKPLARRNALSLSDAHWDADVGRLAAAIGLRPRRALWFWAAGGAFVAALGLSSVGTWHWFSPAAPADPAARLLGVWQAEVTYAWGARHAERFDFQRHAGQWGGSASFLAYPRTIEKLEFDGFNLRFETRTQQILGEETRELTHRYSAELRGQPPAERLVLRMQTSGSLDGSRPLEFEASRALVAAPAAGPSSPR